MERETIRTVLNREKRRWGSGILVGFVLFCLGAFTAEKSHGVPWLAFIGFGIFAVALGAAHRSICCPRCQGNLGILMMSSARLFSVPSEIRFCPYCAADFDAGDTDSSQA